LSKQGAKESRKEYYKRYGKSFDELKNFDILSFLGGGDLQKSGYGNTSKGSVQSGDSLAIKGKYTSYIGVQYDVFQKFPLFKRSSKPYYPIYDFPVNMGIVRSRERSIDSIKRKIQEYRKEMSGFSRNDPRRRQKILTRQNYIKELTEKSKRYKHEKEYRQKFLKVIQKNIDISNKGSLRKPSEKYKSYYFRIYWWGKKVPVYLGTDKPLKMAFKNQNRIDDFDEWLKSYGRKLFLQRLGRDESNVRKAQRRLVREKNLNLKSLE